MQRKFTFSLVVSSLLAGALYADTNAMSQNSAGAENNATGGGALTDIRTYQLGAVEITATEKADSNPTVTIVSKDEIDKTASLDVAQALRFTPGVFYSPAGDSPSASTIYIRGFSEGETGFYYDGIPINDIYAGNAVGETDLTPFITFGLSEIQISKGYTSPTFSSSKMGGAINMVSSIPVKDLEFNAKYQFISNNEHRTGLQVGRNFGTDYFQLTFSHFERKSLNYSYDYSGEGATEIPYTSYRSYMFSGKYGFVFDKHEYSVNFYHQHANRGDINWGPSGGTGKKNIPFYDKTAFYLLGNSNFGSVSLNSKVWYHMNLNSTGSYNRSNGSAWSSKYDDYTIGLTESLQFDFSENQNLKFGIMAKNDSHEATDWNVDFAKRDWQVLNSSVFTEYALRANDMFRFVISGSYDRHDGLNVKNRTTAGSEKIDNKHLWGWTLQGILYAHLGNSMLLHANVGHKTNLPKVRALYDEGSGEYAKNSNLTSESLINYELGGEFNHKFEGLGTTSFGATAFFNDIDNVIIESFVPDGCDNPTSNGCVYYENARDGYSVGGEVFVKQGFWADRFVLGANWNYIQRKSSKGRSGDSRATEKREFTTHPRQNINFSALLAPRKEYDVSFNGSVQTSRYFYDSALADYVKLPTVFLVDFVANYYLKDNLKLSAGAYNLFDKNYNYESGSYASAAAGGLAGRRVFTSLEYRY